MVVTELPDIIQNVTPVGGYRSLTDLERDTDAVIQASNPVGNSLQSITKQYNALGEPDLFVEENPENQSQSELASEWDETRKGMKEMYSDKVSYLEWEYRRSYLLELLGEIASDEFDQDESSFIPRHRINIEIQMWTNFAKKLLLSIGPQDVQKANKAYGFVDIEVKHTINETVMTTGSLFETVGAEILVRNHELERDDHFNMSLISDNLSSHGYLTDREYDEVNTFRKNIRNQFAHDALKRTRFTNFSNFRSDVVSPCWNIINIASSLSESNISPD